MNKNNSCLQPRVLVTGGAQRIGAALVESLHSVGMRVAIHCRTSTKEALRISERLNQRVPASASVHTGDLVDDKTPSRLIEEVVERYAGLDVLINNASSFFPTPIAETTNCQWENLLATNLKAPFFLSQAAAPHLAKSKGIIINIADIYGERPMSGFSVYSIAKAGLLMMTKALAQELGPDVRVNAIAPGAILWPEHPTADPTRQRVIDNTPLNSIGDPRDIVSAALFLIRDANFITGQTIAVDGGRTTMQL